MSLSSSLAARLDELEEKSSCCILECDGPGYLDAKLRRTDGIRIIIVRFFAVRIRATELGALAISSFKDAALHDWNAAGIVVVADRAFKYIAPFMKQPVSLTVFEAFDSLALPNCAEIHSSTVWIVICSKMRHRHRGYASACFSQALKNDAVVKARPNAPGSVAPHVYRALFYDVRYRECDAVLSAIHAGDDEVAVAAFPGQFETHERIHPGTGECPICLELPTTRITTKCCKRDFCLGCFAKSMKDDVSPCPWCRGTTGMFNCSLESGHTRAPIKDILLMDCVGQMLTAKEKVLVVTLDDSYLVMSSPLNPIRPYMPILLSGGSKTMDRAVKEFQCQARVAVAHGTRMLCGGMKLPATVIVFTERASWDDENMKASWISTCPGLRRIICMVSVVDACPAV